MEYIAFIIAVIIGIYMAAKGVIKFLYTRIFQKKCAWCSLKKIKYIIMEEPKSEINLKYLPKDTYSKYINSPTPDEIRNFMIKNNFIEIQRISENEIEDNVMYKNINV